jgi:hypothetical protein
MHADQDPAGSRIWNRLGVADGCALREAPQRRRVSWRKELVAHVEERVAVE